MENIEKRWCLVFDEYKGLKKQAINMLSGVISGYVSYVLPVKPLEEMNEELKEKNNLIVVGTLEENSLLKTCETERLITVPNQEEGYSIYVGENPWQKETQLIVIAGRDERGVLYGCMDFCNKYCGDILYKEGYLYKIYPERAKNPVVGGLARYKGKNIFQVLDEKQENISKCVFGGENNAVDNQVVNMSFASGATAHLTMTAFSDRCYRFIKVHGTKGEVYGDVDEGILYFTEYGKDLQKIDVNKLTDVSLKGGHGGGDYYLTKDFIDYITVNSPSFTRTTIDDSIDSHVMGFKAEESRLSGGKVIKLDE